MTDSTPASQQINESIQRIDELTEQLVSAAQNSHTGFLQAHEKMLRDLAAFSPRADSPAFTEWLQALGAAHATYVQEATSAFVTAAGKAAEAGDADSGVAARIRELNEQVVAQAKTAGTDVLDRYENVLRDLVQFETTAAGAGQLEWMQAVASAHTRFLTGLGTAYADAARHLLKN